MAEVPPGVVTVTSITPAGSAGEVAVQVVADEQLTEVPGVDPKVTDVLPMKKLVPVMVTTVPPPRGPDDGEMPVTVGTAA